MASPGVTVTRRSSFDDHLPRVLRGRWQALAGIVVFCALAIVVCGSVSPLSSSSMPVCSCGDAVQEVWFLAWPAYAISHGMNPFFTNYLAYPRGLDLMSSTSMPLLGIIASPVTLTLGPVAAFNLLIRVAFATSATSMFLVLRRYVTWWPAAFMGGLLYGFSPYMLNEGYSHLFLIFVPLPPIIFLLLEDLLVTSRWRPTRTGAALGLAAVAQLLISAETLAITVIVALAGVAILALRHPVAARQAMRAGLNALFVAVAVFLVLAGYPVWAYVAGPQHVSGPQHPKLTYVLFHNDLFATVLPTVYQLLGPTSWKIRGDVLFQGNPVDHVSYLGIPLVLLLGYLALRYRRVGMVAEWALLGLGALVLTLGARLYIDGTIHAQWLRLPYDVLLHLPLLDGLLAPRFILAVYLAAAVILAVGLDRVRRDGLFGSGMKRHRAITKPARGALRTVTCVTLGAVALVPFVPWMPFVSDPIPLPSFFARSAMVDRIPVGSVVLTYPNPQLPTVFGAAFPQLEAMLWQAEQDMHFRIVGAYAAQPYAGGVGQGNELLDQPKVVQELFGWALYGSSAVTAVPVTPAVLAALRHFCTEYSVSTILVDPTLGMHPSVVVSYVSAALGRPPQHLGGLDAWFDVTSVVGDG
jgi:hypothetical protein